MFTYSIYSESRFYENNLYQFDFSNIRSYLFIFLAYFLISKNLIDIYEERSENLINFIPFIFLFTFIFSGFNFSFISSIFLYLGIVSYFNREGNSKFNFIYDDKISLLEKIEAVANKIYRASSVEISDTIKEQLTKLEQAGYSKFPICIAKTQYSFSVDPKIKGAPTDHKLEVREIRLSSGAEFIVVICGTIMTMPGLPRTPAADKIKLNKKGDIEGLF